MQDPELILLFQMLGEEVYRNRKLSDRVEMLQLNLAAAHSATSDQNHSGDPAPSP